MEQPTNLQILMRLTNRATEGQALTEIMADFILTVSTGEQDIEGLAKVAKQVAKQRFPDKTDFDG